MNSYTEHTASAGQTVFTFSFPYMSTEHIEVFINQVETLDFTVTGAAEITLDTGATEGDTVRVGRNTLREDATPMVTYATGRLRAEDLNTATKQNFYLAQEAYEQGSIGNSVQIEVNSDAIEALDDRLTSLETQFETTPPTFVYTVSVDDPVSEDGNNGEFWFVREA